MSTHSKALRQRRRKTSNRLKKCHFKLKNCPLMVALSLSLSSRQRDHALGATSVIFRVHLSSFAFGVVITWTHATCDMDMRGPARSEKKNAHSPRHSTRISNVIQIL